MKAATITTLTLTTGAALLLALSLAPETEAAGPPGGLDVTVINTPANPVPVVTEQGAAQPVFLQFGLNDNNNWRSDEYLVPEGKRLRVEFVSAGLGGNSSAVDDVSTAVELRIEFTNGVGATCNDPDENQCQIFVPVLTLNNSATGANMGTVFPSAMGLVSFEVPAGASVEAHLASTLGAPDAGGGVGVVVAGSLVDEE